MFDEEVYQESLLKVRELEFMAGRFRGIRRSWSEFGDESVGDELELYGAFRLGGLHFEQSVRADGNRKEKVLSVWSYNSEKQLFVRWSFGAYMLEPAPWTGEFETNQLVMTQQRPYPPWRDVIEQKDDKTFICSIHIPARSFSGYYRGSETVLVKLAELES